MMFLLPFSYTCQTLFLNILTKLRKPNHIQDKFILHDFKEFSGYLRGENDAADMSKERTRTFL